MKIESPSRWTTPLVMGLAALLAVPAGELGAAQQRVPKSTSQPSASSAPSAPSTRTAVPRSTTRTSGKPTARDTRRVSPGDYGRRSHGGSRGHHGSRGYFGFGFRYPYYYHPYSWGLGWNWGWGYWGPAYYGGYWGPGPYRARSVDYDMGGLDLNVRPRKTEVYVDGDFVGLAKDFDGWPSYLWLEEGTYQVAFYREGYRTLTQTYRVRPGLIIDARVRLQAGEATPPVRPATAARSAPEPAPARAAAPRGEDARPEPGRLQLRVAPPDASVYLDGRFLGSGTELASLHSGLLVEPGDHVLEVVRPGYEARQLDFSVAAGDEVDLRVDLEQ